MTRSPDRRLTDEDYGGPADRHSCTLPEPCAIETGLSIETPMEKPLFSSHPEPINGNGEIVLGVSQLTMLHGLLDRSGGTAQSHRAWIRAAYPYMGVASWPTVQGRAMRAIRTLHPRWVTTIRIGSRKVTQLADRGYAILDLKVPVHIRGFGRYNGLGWKRR